MAYKKQNKREPLFSKDDIIDAYRKLKTYFYYDNSALFMKRKIADFEYKNENIEDIFNHLAEILNTQSEDIYKYFITDQTILRENLVDFYLLPKSFDNNILEQNSKNIIITNRYTSEIYEFSKFNFLIDIPIELHIINVLWIVKLGYLLDSDYCYYSDKNTSYCYANRLEIDEDKKCILPGNKLFKLYSSQYQKWRDDCIEATEDLLNNHKKDAIIISLDIKRYYPSVNLNYDDINRALKQRCNNEQFENYKFLTNILKNIRNEYIEQIKNVIIKEEKDFSEILPSESPIPIGMLSSNVIANWYLKDFDKQLIKQVKPIYYGRYVDDMLIVLENTGGCNKDNCDKTNCVENRKLTTKNIIEKYFFNDVKKTILKRTVKKTKNKELVEYNINIHKCNLKIQEEKIKLFVFDENGSKAMLLKFKDNLRKHSSEFRFLPDEDRIDEDFVQNSYSIDYCDTINKLRSVDSYQLDKFKISTYLAKQLTIAKYAKDNNHYAKTKEELLYAFSGRLGLDLYCYWDKVLTYFLLNNDDTAIYNFIKKISLSIERISYKADNFQNDIENKIKKELERYLKEALYLTLSLYPKYIYKNTNDPNQDLTLKNLFYKLNQAKGYFAEEYDEVVSAYRKSLMIKHKYCFMPIINYLDLPSDSNISFIEKDLTKCLKKGNFKLDSEKLKFNPKNFTIQDLLLLEYYQQFIENTKSINKIHENAVKNYINLNLKQYSSEIDNSFYNKKQTAIQSYFEKILSLKTENQPQYKNKENQPYKICIDKNNENKSIDLYKVRFGLYNTKVLDSDITKNLQGNLNLTFKDLQKLIKFLNMSIQTNASKANIIVFPEVSIPIQWLGLLSDFSKKHNVAIICGLKHIIDDKTKIVRNYIATLLPFKYGYKNDCYITFRLKKWYAPGEEKEIKKHKLNVPDDRSNIKNILFIWNNLHFAVYDCFELADINFRSEFKSKVDFIIGCEWNRDIKYFTNITEAAARDLHCYVIQVNTSQFGDSKIIAPKKSDEMTILNIKGGDDNILIGEVNIEELREFQRKETLYLEDKDKTYKTLPPDFDKNVLRLKK